MGKQLTAAHTPVTTAQMLEALGRAWMRAFNYSPTRESICVLLAQWGLETGRGKSMMNYNVAGVKCPDVTARWDYTSYETKEGYGPTERTLVPPDPGCRFRAFATLEDGCADYLDVLHGRFVRAWPAIEKGSPVLFVHVLKQIRYFTGDEKKYTDAVKSMFAEFMKLPPAQWEIEAQQQAREAPTQPELAASERTTFAPVVGIVTDPENDSEPPPPKAA